MGESPRFFGIEVDFPYPQPYQAQRAIMAKAMSGFVKQENAILESPTGTGKSLALLCSSLAYQEYMKRKFPAYQNYQQNASEDSQEGEVNPVPQIWFTSRTHSQLKQLVRELRKLNYTPTMAILASKSQVCVNQRVRSSGDVERGCLNIHTRLRMCPYGNNSQHNGIPNEFRKGGSSDNKLLKYDLEDLEDFCREKVKCPYIISRALIKQADLVFAPYNYVIDSSIREQMKINLRGAVLIIDEAHNIESTCRESATLKLTMEEVRRGVEWSTFTEAQAQLYTNLVNPFKAINSLFESFSQYLINKRSTFQHNSPTRKDQKRFNFDYIAEQDTEKALREFFNLTNTYWPLLYEDFKYITKVNKENTNPDETRIPHEAFMALINKVFGPLSNLFFENGAHLKDFKIVYKHSKNDENDDQINIICLNPAVVFKQISSVVHNVILTSGTLSPLSSFASELGASFPILLSAMHVIDPCQVQAFSLSKAPNGDIMSSTQNSIMNSGDKMYVNLAIILKKFLPLIPGGVLFFLQSYGMLTKLLQCWRKNGEFQAIDSIKKIFVEEQNKKANKTYDQYKIMIQNGGGAILLAVCRGKMSEGMDFTDNQARAVFIFGIPYPSIYESDIQLKKEYNDAMKKETRGDEWYEAQAYRSLYQAIGRCIRHQRDYGAIFLIDARFEKVISKFPRWVVSSYDQNLSVSNNYEGISRKIKDFYFQMAIKFPTKSDSVSPDAPFDLTCATCFEKLYSKVIINPKSTSLQESQSFLALVGEKKSQFVYFLKKEERESSNIKKEEAIYYPKESIALRCLKCPKCDTVVGASIKATSFKKQSLFHNSWLLIDQFYANQMEISQPLEKVVQKPKLMTIQMSSNDSKQALLNFV